MRRHALHGALRRQHCCSLDSRSEAAHARVARRYSNRPNAAKPMPSQSPQPAQSSSSSSVSSGPSTLQQQLSFCCLMCGWETACTSCPFDWYGFDPRKFRNSQGRRRTSAAGPGERAGQHELQEALAVLGLAGRVDARDIKTAFRAKALEWHPDCSAHDDAEDTFKEIVRAYELLLASFPSSQ